MSAISLKNITKSYKNIVVLDDITYTFSLGKAYMLIGSNGSGKSTLIKAILGLIKYSGEIELDNNLKVSYIPENINFPDYVSLYDFLENLGQIKKVENLPIKIERELEKWDLIGSKDKFIHQLSKGMKQKLLIINAIISEYDIYIFDEPLNGLDIKNQNIFLDKIIELKKENKTIIISTHFVNFYQNFCDVVLEINNGKIYEKNNKMSF